MSLSFRPTASPGWLPHPHSPGRGGCREQMHFFARSPHPQPRGKPRPEEKKQRTEPAEKPIRWTPCLCAPSRLQSRGRGLQGQDSGQTLGPGGLGGLGHGQETGRSCLARPGLARGLGIPTAWGKRAPPAGWPSCPLGHGPQALAVLCLRHLWEGREQREVALPSLCHRAMPGSPGVPPALRGQWAAHRASGSYRARLGDTYEAGHHTVPLAVGPGGPASAHRPASRGVASRGALRHAVK